MIFSGCTSLGTMAISENGKISFIKSGTWKIEEPKLINQNHTSISFLGNGNVYIWKGNEKEIVGFNENGKKVFDTSPTVFYGHLGELHLVHDNMIIGEYYTTSKEFRLDIGFLIFNENGNIKDKWNWEFNDKHKFYPRGYNIHNLPDNQYIASGTGWEGSNPILIGKFKYPEYKILNLGGNIGPGYDGGGITWNYSKSIIVDSSLFYIVSTSPFIRQLNLDLNYIGNKGIKGEHFEMGDFEKNPNFGHWDYNKDKEPFQEWIIRNSRTIDLFRHGNYSCVLYREVLGVGNKYWCQVYSRDLEKYYGEVELPEMPIGRDSKYIYFRDLRRNDPRILKTRIRVK